MWEKPAAPGTSVAPGSACSETLCGVENRRIVELILEEVAKGKVYNNKDRSWGMKTYGVLLDVPFSQFWEVQSASKASEDGPLYSVYDVCWWAPMVALAPKST